MNNILVQKCKRSPDKKFCIGMFLGLYTHQKIETLSIPKLYSLTGKPDYYLYKCSYLSQSNFIVGYSVILMGA